MLRDVLISLAAAFVVIALAVAGLTVTLGAHPVWQVSVAVIGAPVGAILSLLARRIGWSGPLPALCTAVLTVGAFGVAHFGKTRFAASFAEDFVAGQFWYLGWIATAGFATLTLALVLRAR